MKLILYFSAEKGKTAKIAQDFAKKQQEVTVLEIKPEVPYTSADLRYINPLARCNKEKLMKKDVPSETKVPDWENYDVVYLGFPIWYGGAPNIINTFCKGLDWTGKKVHIFATSMTSGIGKTAEKLKPFLNGAEIVDAKRVKSAEEMQDYSHDGGDKFPAKNDRGYDWWLNKGTLSANKP